MTSWQQLETALDDAAGRGEVVRFWWRDDDAGHPSPALTRLLELSESRNLPLALAVVPAWLQPEAQGQIAGNAEITVLQHGYAHTNHAEEGAKSIELGGRATDRIVEELGDGLSILKDAFGAAFRPVLVPPWNRIDQRFYPSLHTLGFRGLSVFGRRDDSEIVPGVSLINTHIDPIDWRGSRAFLGEDIVLGRLLDQLDLDEPIGILSHHLVTDEPCWRFLERLLTLLHRHPAAHLSSASDLFVLPNLSSGYAA